MPFPGSSGMCGVHVIQVIRDKVNLIHHRHQSSFCFSIKMDSPDIKVM